MTTNEKIETGWQYVRQLAKENKDRVIYWTSVIIVVLVLMVLASLYFNPQVLLP